MGMGSMQSSRGPHLTYPMLGFMLWCHSLKLLNTFWTRDFTFSFWVGPHRWYCQSWTELKNKPSVYTVDYYCSENGWTAASRSPQISISTVAPLQQIWKAGKIQLFLFRDVQMSKETMFLKAKGFYRTNQDIGYI